MEINTWEFQWTGTHWVSAEDAFYQHCWIVKVHRLIPSNYQHNTVQFNMLVVWETEWCKTASTWGAVFENNSLPQHDRCAVVYLVPAPGPRLGLEPSQHYRKSAHSDSSVNSTVKLFNICIYIYMCVCGYVYSHRPPEPPHGGLGCRTNIESLNQ